MFISLQSFSQESADSINQVDPTRAELEYVQSFPNHFFLWPVVKQRSLNFEVRKEGTNKYINYKPNSAFTIGVGAYIFDLAFEITFAVPIEERAHDKYGSSNAKDLQINALSRSWGADLYHQKYDGFYVDDPSASRPKGAPFPQRPDIHTRNFGISGLYAFNSKRFSLKSSINFADRQLHRSGSVLLMGTLNNFKLNADSSVLAKNYHSSFGAGSSFEDLRYTTFSLAPGYSYTFVYRNFFLSGAFMVGPAHNWIYYKNEDGIGKNDIRINAFTSFRGGIGYSGDRFFAGINFVQQSRIVRIEDMRFTNSSSTFRLLIGFRFREFGVLRKSVWDFPKELFSLLKPS